MQLVEHFKKFLISRQSEQIEDKVKNFIYLINNMDSIDNDTDYGVPYEIVDFFDIINGNQTRWQSFAKYIETEFPRNRYNRILDIGCGPLADLTSLLSEKGYETTGIDPKADRNGKNKIIKANFNYLATAVSSFDLLVGLQPCDATEHIIRSSMQNSIPCVVSLCQETHDSLDGRKFVVLEEWYDYLLSLTSSCGVLEEKIISDKPHTLLKIK